MHALIENGLIIRVGALPDWRDGDTGAPLSDDQWLSHGWLPVEDDELDYDPLTHGLSACSREVWKIQADRVVRTFELRELPPAPPTPPPVIVVNPADLWRRSTDAEAEAIEDAMSSQTARLRNLFRSAQTYQSDDPLWPTLEAVATQLFGADRAAELLAPSV